MALFIDTFVNKIDRKGRVSVPATFRATLAEQTFQGIVAFPSFKLQALQCAGMDWMQSLIDSTQNVDLFSQEHDDLTAALFPDAKQLAFDGEGRIMLPEALCAHAKLTEMAAFAGRGRYFENLGTAGARSLQGGGAPARRRQAAHLAPASSPKGAIDERDGDG